MKKYVNYKDKERNLIKKIQSLLIFFKKEEKMKLENRVDKKGA